jgi:hypothetical protein
LAAREIALQKVVGRDLEVERGLRRVIGDGRPVSLGEHAEDAAYAGRTLVIVDIRADRAEMRAGVTRPLAAPRSSRACGSADRPPQCRGAARRADVFSEQ